jgi:hypothetical protein
MGGVIEVTEQNDIRRGVVGRSRYLALNPVIVQFLFGVASAVGWSTM